MKNKITLSVLLCALIGYALGEWAAYKEARPRHLDLSSESSSKDFENQYKLLPCPSEKEFIRLAKYVNLEIPEGPSLDLVCDNEMRASFGKVLLLMSQLKFNFPKEWPEKLKENIGHPLTFLKERSSKLSLDLNQKDSLAYNKVQSKEIYLGGRFFTLDPLEGIAILMHEARHSEPQAASHVTCEAGDIPRGPGACDAAFSMDDSDAGAYAYGTLFNLSLALYAERIAPADRKKALTDALVELAARFNIIPEALAKKSDTLVVLTEDSQLQTIQLSSGASKNISLKFETDDEKPQRIEFSPKNNGLLIYTNKGKVWVWSPLKGLNKFYPELLSQAGEMHDVARMRIPFQEMTLYVLRDSHGSLSYVEYLPSINNMARTPYPYTLGRRRNSSDVPAFKRMFLALNDESLFMSEKGRIYLAPHYGDESPFNEVDALQSPHGWMAGTGGALYDSLYLIDNRGDLFEAEMNLVSTEESESRHYSVKASSLQTAHPIKKFQQGLGLSMALDRDGHLYFWKHRDLSMSSSPVHLANPIRDFVLTQTIRTDKKLTSETE